MSRVRLVKDLCFGASAYRAISSKPTRLPSSQRLRLQPPQQPASKLFFSSVAPPIRRTPQLALQRNKAVAIAFTLLLTTTTTTTTVRAQPTPSQSPEPYRSKHYSMAWHSSGKTNDDLINNLIKGELITSKEVAQAMRSIDRANFVLDGEKHAAYLDSPLPIGHNATISAPHMHAMCLELLKDNLQPGARALDIGSGSGYLCAVMATMVGPKGHVYGVEHIPELVDFSIKNVQKQDAKLLDRVTLKAADGRLGWPEGAPYDCIHVGAAAPKVPPVLLDQLKVGGKMVIPVGPQDGDQYLYLVEKVSEKEYRQERVTGVRYVPLTDKHKYRGDL